jgi:hypothetical protein
MQLASMHFRYSLTHTHLPADHLHHLRRARMCALSHPQNSIEYRIIEACNELRLTDTYPGPPPSLLQYSEPIKEINASPTPTGLNQKSTTDGTSSLAPPSRHILTQLITQTHPSPLGHKHTIESDSMPPKSTYSNCHITSPNTPYQCIHTTTSPNAMSRTLFNTRTKL